MEENIPADLIKTGVTEDTRASFTGNRLKLGQHGVCRNTDVPTRGYELVIRESDGSYKFKNIDGYTKAEVDALVNAVPIYPYSDVKDPSGFVYKGVGISYNSANRTVTVTTSGSEVVKFLYRGQVVSEMVSGWVSDPHPVPSSEITYFLYYDGIDFVWSGVGFEDNQPSVFAVYCNGSFRMPIRESHGVNMSHDAHMELHRTIGTYKITGTGNFSNFTTGSTTATDRRPRISATQIYDEDLPTLVNALTTNSYAWLNLSGAGGTASFTTANAEILATGANGRPILNNFSGGVWTTTEMANNQYTKIFVYAIPSTSDATGQAIRYVFKQGQLASTNLATVQGYTVANYTLSTAGMLATEFVAIGEIIVQATANNWVITSIATLSGTKLGQVSAPVSSPLFALSFKFTRTGPTAYGGGDVDLPYTSFIEDGTLTIPQELGVNATAPVSTITVVTFQFNLIPYNTTCYIKINGVKTILGTMTAGTKFQTFTIAQDVVAGDWIVFGYTGAQSGLWTYPTATGYIRTAGA